MTAIIFLIVWGAAIFCAHQLGVRRNRKYGWVWGFLLGWIGVIVVACLRDAKDKEMEQLERQLRIQELQKRLEQ